ncbi:hypothetical protein GCM10023158_09930 [Gluconacetobacter tumulicola]
MFSDVLFLRTFAGSFDEQVGEAARDRFLRVVGTRMAERLLLPPCATIEALELELNAALALIQWGTASLHMDRDSRRLLIRHVGLPKVGGLGAPAGTWLLACLAGLYETWIGRQPDATPGCVISWDAGQDCSDGTIVLEYGMAQK